MGSRSCRGRDDGSAYVSYFSVRHHSAAELEVGRSFSEIFDSLPGPDSCRSTSRRPILPPLAGAVGAELRVCSLLLLFFARRRGAWPPRAAADSVGWATRADAGVRVGPRSKGCIERTCRREHETGVIGARRTRGRDKCPTAASRRHGRLSTWAQEYPGQAPLSRAARSSWWAGDLLLSHAAALPSSRA